MKAFHKGKCVGTVVCKMGEHRNTFRGYIAMLVVLNSYRGRGIGESLIPKSSNFYIHYNLCNDSCWKSLVLILIIILQKVISLIDSPEYNLFT